MIRVACMVSALWAGTAPSRFALGLLFMTLAGSVMASENETLEAAIRGAGLDPLGSEAFCELPTNHGALTPQFRARRREAAASTLELLVGRQRYFFFLGSSAGLT